MGAPPSVVGLNEIVTLCQPGVIAVIFGTPGTVGSVTTGPEGCEAGPTPALLIAATEHV